MLVLGAKRGLMLPRYIREPILLAFSTASSEAAFPKTLEQLERFGVPNRIAGFVLPLGYSFNLDGSMMYMTFAVMFIAQVYGVDLSIGQQITMLLLLMVTSKGMAAVPRASLVVIAATLQFFDLPEAGLVLILAIDQFLDMGRSGTNVVGNAVAATVVAKWGKPAAAAATPRSGAAARAHPYGRAWRARAWRNGLTLYLTRTRNSKVNDGAPPPVSPANTPVGRTRMASTAAS